MDTPSLVPPSPPPPPDSFAAASSPPLLKPRRIPAQNVVRKLWLRELTAAHGAAAYTRSRHFYTNVFPSHTIVDVEHPPCYLRKFTPDGRLLVAFSIDQTSVHVYEYRGAASANDLLAGVRRRGHAQLSAGDRDDNDAVRSKLFDRMFVHRHTVCVSKEGECLNRECSLFTNDGRFLVVSSASYHMDEIRRQSTPFLDVFRNNESLSPNKINLENYTIHIIDINTGKLTDCKHFLSDKIYLSHNQGIYLYEDVLALFSVQHQTIHIFKLDDEGKLTKLLSLGHLCSLSEERDIEDLTRWSKNSLEPEDSVDHFAVVPDFDDIDTAFFDNMLTTLKHRLMTHFYREALLHSRRTGNNMKIAKFHRSYNMIKELRIWRMQLMDENTILLKYSSEDVANQIHNDPNSKLSIFVIFDFMASKVLYTYENTNDEFLLIFEKHCDSFRNTSLTRSDALVPHLSQYTCSASNNFHAREANNRFKKSIISAKHGGEVEAIKRLLSQVPISSQSFCLSPYLDLSLFSYDDKWVSVLERPKTCTDAPIRFFQRDSGMLRFCMYAGPVNRSTANHRRLVAFTFHPSDPFTISVQRTNSDYIVNFHLRIDPGIYNNTE